MWPIERRDGLQGGKALLHASEEDDGPWLEDLELGAEGLVLLTVLVQSSAALRTCIVLLET